MEQSSIVVDAQNFCKMGNPRAARHIAQASEIALQSGLPLVFSTLEDLSIATRKVGRLTSLGLLNGDADILIRQPQRVEKVPGPDGERPVTFTHSNAFIRQARNNHHT
jgi:hypothetical protein